MSSYEGSGNMKMNPEQFDRELKYQVTMYFCRKMLEKGIITIEDYLNIDAEKRSRLRPVTGNLLSSQFLLDQERMQGIYRY